MRPPTSQLLALLAALTTLGLHACGGDAGTLVVVELVGRPAMQPVGSLEVTVANAGGSATQTFTLDSGEQLPLSFSITPEGRDGELTVTVLAKGGDGLPRGRGSATVAIVPGARADATLTVEPDDFPVNNETARTQWISFNEDMAGRQIGVAPDGTFIITWENDCPLSRCDILGRHFAADTTPIQNGTTMNDGDFIINQNPESTVTPVIAAGLDGYLVAWLAGPDGLSIPEDVAASVVGFDGSHPVPFESSVSLDVQPERDPAAFARSDGSYVVTWARLRVAPEVGSEIRARLFSAEGEPLTNPVTGDTGDFPVAAATTGDMILPFGAGLAGGAFVIVWQQTDGGVTNVRGRVFSSTGSPATGSDAPFSNYATGFAYGPRVAATEEGFVVAWQVFSSSEPALMTAPMYVRRFTGNGNAVSTEIAVASETFRANAAPIIAVRADGTIGVTWHDCGDFGDVPGSCGIHFRLLRSTGMPVGDAIVANSTTVGDQLSPSIAAFGDDAFLLAWTDGSQLAPDTDGSGVRARVIYPSLDRRDGTIGAHCDGANDAPCGADLICQPAADNIKLCHPTCTTECPGGGVCLNGTYCAFQ